MKTLLYGSGVRAQRSGVKAQNCSLLPGPGSIAVAGLLSLLAIVPAPAAGKSYELTVQAGKHDRTNTPVKVVLKVPADANSATLIDPQGNTLPAQFTPRGLIHPVRKPSPETGELHFILPSLAKGQKLTLTLNVSKDPPPPGHFVWKDTPGKQTDLRWGDRPVLRYMYQAYDDSTPQKRHDTYKVYHHLFSPAGDRVVTKGPGGRYTHHRGLFFGYCRCSYGGRRVDTWGCGSGHQVHVGFGPAEAGSVLGRHRVAVAWRGNDKKPFVNEQRELTVYHVPGGTLVEFASRLSSPGGKVRLEGNSPHAGFQFRAAEEVAAKTEKLTYYLRPDGKGELGQARAKAIDLPWDAISFVLGEDRYTVVYLDKPTNPKPVEYNERTYGRFGSFFPYEIEEGKDLEVNYRIWLQAGEMTLEEAEALCADFVEPVEVTIK